MFYLSKRAFISLAISLKDAKNKWPEISRELDEAISLGLKNKYLEWFATQLKAGEEFSYLVEMAKKFEDALEKKKLDILVVNEKYPKEIKDINWWKNHKLEELEEALFGVENSSLSQAQHEQSAGADKLYDDGRFAVYHINDYKQMRSLGWGTNWCVTIKDSYDGFKEHDTYFLVIVDRKNLNKDLGRIALVCNHDSGSKPYLVNARDQGINFSTIKSWPVWETIINYLGSTKAKTTEKELEIDDFWASARKGDEKILDHPWVTQIKNKYGQTPLHFLADLCAKELDMYEKSLASKLFAHPQVANVFDDAGRTPLHILARNWFLKKEILNHPQANIVKNREGFTPVDILKEELGDDLSDENEDRVEVTNKFVLSKRAFISLAISLKDAKNKWPEFSNEFTKAIFLGGIKNKYLEWLAFQLKAGEEFFHLIDMAKKFESTLEKKKLDILIVNKKYPENIKDINWWKNRKLQELEDVLFSVEKSSLSQAQHEQSAGATKLYDDGRSVAYYISDYEQMRALGHNTKWCVTVEETYVSYKDQEMEFIVLIDRENLNKPMGKVAIAYLDGKKTESFDAEDNPADLEDFPAWNKIKNFIVSKGIIEEDAFIENDLFTKASMGYASILSHPQVATIRDGDGCTPLHILAEKKVKEVLNHPEVATVRDMDGWTPLHNLASHGIKEALNHPEVGTILNNNEWTPLHFLARAGVREILNHPDANKVKNGDDMTPAQIYNKMWANYQEDFFRKHLTQQEFYISKRAMEMVCPKCFADVSNLDPKKDNAGLYKMLTCPNCNSGFYPQDAMLAVKKTQEKDIGEWTERGWWGLWFAGWFLGFANSEAKANLAKRRIIKLFMEDNWETQEDFPVVNLFFEKIWAESVDHLQDYLITKYFRAFPEKRKAFIENALEIHKAAPDFTPSTNSIIEGAVPTNKKFKDLSQITDDEKKELGTNSENSINRFKDVIAPVVKRTLEEKKKIDLGIDPKHSSSIVYISKRAQMTSALKTAQSLYKIIMFLFFRVPQKDKQKFLAKLKGKILRINPGVISLKKMGPGSSIGQSISFTKNLLSGLSPVFTKDVLIELSKLLTQNIGYMKPLPPEAKRPGKK